MSDATTERPDIDDEPYEYHAPNGDPQSDEDEPEGDGRWVNTPHGWIYE